MELPEITAELRSAVDRLRFGPPVTHVYDPLDYAWDVHRRYLERFGRKRGRILLLGMNPGPFGMAQTGIPFGDVGMVRDWMKLDGEVGRPDREHPRRPVEGFACPRSEVSGTRFWGWARERYGPARSFFARFFVINYCPLVFMEESGRNRTPDKLPASEREALFAVCDAALERMIERLRPSYLLGVGRFAELRARQVLEGRDVPVGRVPHPSPASPQANRGWGALVDGALDALELSP